MIARACKCRVRWNNGAKRKLHGARVVIASYFQSQMSNRRKAAEASGCDAGQLHT